jgi:hypothetical protein
MLLDQTQRMITISMQIPMSKTLIAHCRFSDELLQYNQAYLEYQSNQRFPEQYYSEEPQSVSPKCLSEITWFKRRLSTIIVRISSRIYPLPNTSLLSITIRILPHRETTHMVASTQINRRCRSKTQSV